MASKFTAVLVHVAWADGSSWSKVIPRLEDAAIRPIAVQLPLNPGVLASRLRQPSSEHRRREDAHRLVLGHDLACTLHEQEEDVERTVPDGFLHGTRAMGGEDPGDDQGSCDAGRRGSKGPHRGGLPPLRDQEGRRARPPRRQGASRRCGSVNGRGSRDRPRVKRPGAWTIKHLPVYGLLSFQSCSSIVVQDLTPVGTMSLAQMQTKNVGQTSDGSLKAIFFRQSPYCKAFRARATLPHDEAIDCDSGCHQWTVSHCPLCQRSCRPADRLNSWRPTLGTLRPRDDAPRADRERLRYGRTITLKEACGGIGAPSSLKMAHWVDV